MAYNPQNLSVLAYANGFTLWHYTTIDTAADTEAAGYFDGAADLLRAGDLVLVSADTDGSPESKLTGIADITSGVVTLGNVPNQAAFVADPSGGSTVDTECRAQLATALAALRTAGLMAAA
ncbi:MAG: hypothetical protein RIC16_14985 [Rhodospirillales bacterium]